MLKKRPSYFFLFSLLSSLLFTACGEDDSPQEDDVKQISDPTLTGSVVFDGTSVDISHGIIIGRGVLSDGFTYDFWISDDIIDISNEAFPGEVVIELRLSKEDATAFSEGTFELRSSTFEPENSAEIRVFRSSEVIENGSGTVVVQGSGTEYQLTLDIMIEDGRTITGTVSGTFPFTDLSPD